MELVFASANKHKIEEINSLLDSTFKLSGLSTIGITEEIPEPGNTIKENSYLKALYVKEYLLKLGKELPVFADDSGLEVEAMNGAPGVFSARFAGQPKNDLNNNAKLLLEMKRFTNRRARFVTVVTLLLNNEVHYFEGEVKGTIAFEPRGTQGFGYDPLFIPQGYRSTFAELGADVKNQISHRAKAVSRLVQFLKK